MSMKRVIQVAAFVTLATLVSSAAAAPPDLAPSYGACLRPDGSVYHPSECLFHPCRCPSGMTPFAVDDCAPREAAAPNAPAANRARALAFANGTLRSARYEGRRFCLQIFRNDPMDNGANLTPEQ
ncbi:MAG TPA: hypothetical protein VG407_03635 [Caulobacteraceae bacterium]|nr:hypothetical protein [Caulobacteraceae bacterium]